MCYIINVNLSTADIINLSGFMRYVQVAKLITVSTVPVYRDGCDMSKIYIMNQPCSRNGKCYLSVMLF